MGSDLVDLSKELAEYIKEELGVETETHNGIICMYHKKPSTMRYGSDVLIYLGCVEIAGEKLKFSIGGNNSLFNYSSKYINLPDIVDLSDPESFNVLFDKINKFVDHKLK